MNFYATDYIRRALSDSAQIEEPDAKRAGAHHEALASLYEAYQLGGAKTSRMAWETIRNYRPELAQQFAYQRNIYSAAQLATIPKPRYLLASYPIYEGGANLLVGARGTGKSFVAVDIAASSAAAGKRVLYIAAEGANVYDGRLSAWRENRQQDAKSLTFYGRSVATGDDNEFSAFERYVVAPLQPELIIIDTVARCMVGMDENSSSDMKRFVDRWDKFTQRGVTVLFVHHTNRMGTQRGSGVLDDAADSVMVLQKLDEAIALRNDQEAGGKNRASKEHAPLYFQIRSVEIPPRYIGDDAAAVLVAVDKKEVDLTEANGLSERQRAVLDALTVSDEGMTASDLDESLPEISKATVYRQAKQLARAGYIEKRGGMYRLTDKGKESLGIETSDDDGIPF